MKKPDRSPDDKYHADLVSLARAVFELARQTDVHDKKQLELAWNVATELKSVLDLHAPHLHPDLGFDISEYLQFRLDDDGTDPTTMTKAYEEDTEEMLSALEKRYNAGKRPSGS